jgi:hypothetical protein
MNIFYTPKDGMTVLLTPEEPKSIVRVIEALIGAFGDDSDVSFLEGILEEAKETANRTLQ